MRKKKNKNNTRVSYAISSTSAIIIIQLSTSFSILSTYSSNALSEYRFSRLKAKLVTRDYLNSQRLISRLFNRDKIFALERSREIIIAFITSKQRDSSSIYVNLEEFIDDLKLKAISHDRRTLKNIKNKLLNKYYKLYYI